MENATPIKNNEFSNTNPEGLTLAEIREEAFNMGYTAGRNDVIEKVRAELIDAYDGGGFAAEVDISGCMDCKKKNGGVCIAKDKADCPATTEECVDAYLAEILKGVAK